MNVRRITGAVLFIALLLVAGACKRKSSSSEDDTSSATKKSRKVTEVAGNYRVDKGRNPNGSGYEGSVKIAASGDTYTIDWTTGGRAFQGLGIVRAGVLGASWGIDSSGGVVVYEVDGGTLRGTWANPGASRLGEETLEGPAGLSGQYQIAEARSAKGVGYTGSVAISKVGEGYRFLWKLNDGSSYDGIGIKRGDVMVVAWPASKAGVVAYQVKGDGLSGKWCQRDGKLGSEVLVR